MATTASPPTITKDLPLFGKVRYTQGETAEPLVVEAIVTDGGTLSYQWYHSVANGSPKIAGATENSYTPPTDEIGSRSYHCEIMNKNPAGLVAWAYSNSVTVTVVAADWSGDDTHTHSYTPTVTDPTCTESGYIVYECDCGDSYGGGAIPATGHQWDGNTCTVCGVTRKVKNTKVVDFFAGLMMGQRIKKIKNAVVKATMYLYGTPSTSGNIGLREGESVTMYDGVVAQNIDEVYNDEMKAQYPNAVIVTTPAGETRLYCVNGQHKANSTGKISIMFGDFMAFELTGGVWVKTTAGNVSLTPIWSNYDIYYQDNIGDLSNTLLLLASDPIPVSGLVGNSYNGTVLGDIDTVYTDERKEQYPYAVLWTSPSVGASRMVSFWIFDHPVYYVNETESSNGYSGLNTTAGANYLAFRYFTGSSNEWSQYGGGTCEHGQIMSFRNDRTYLEWGNHDVLKTDGSVFIASSDPVPVYE